MRPRAQIVLTAILGLVLAGLSAAPAPATSPATSAAPVESREVTFEVENTNSTWIPCLPDDETYELHGQLVGPPVDLDGLGGPLRVNVLVHDIGTGGWFWNLRSHPSYDYATQLAARGETSLVLDRLGYDTSPLDDGRATCLGAHADMLHQVIQHLRAGQYQYADPGDGSAPAASAVVTHGHGVGGLLTQLEAAEFDDVDGLVMMSWADSGPTPLAVRTGLKQARACLRDDYAPFAQTRSDFRNIYLLSAPARVQQAAASRANEDPCGDVASIAALGTSDLGATEVEVPVLLMFGARDKLIRPEARQAQAEKYQADVTMRVFRKTGSSLPLEKAAPQVRASVLRWLSALS